MREAEGVSTREDFLAYVSELLTDLSEHPDQWENLSLQTFLEALGRWVEDSGFNPQPPQAWSAAACLLRAGRGYE